MENTTASALFQLTPKLGGSLGGLLRVPRGLPRFHEDLSARRDSIRGCPAEAVSAVDPARLVLDFIDKKDFNELERGHSALGRKPVHPRFKLGAWLYASLIGVHEASKVKRLTETDLAMRLACGGQALFDRSAFDIREDGTAICPAGTQMEGPKRQGEQRRAWQGVGCADCPLKSKCTKAKQRTLTQDDAHDRLHAAMAKRMAEKGARERYTQSLDTSQSKDRYLPCEVTLNPRQPVLFRKWRFLSFKRQRMHDRQICEKMERNQWRRRILYLIDV